MSCKILIADDEYLARQAIKMALPVRSDISIVAECADGADAAQKISQFLPDIIFLDIQMPSQTGFEVIRSLPLNYHPYLIIVSAHDNFALTAYDHDASDYLLKPFTQERFNKAFQKALRQLELNKAGHVGALSERVLTLVQNNTNRNSISIKDGGKIKVIPCEDVFFIEASGDYVSVNTTQKKYLHSESLTALEKSLDPAVFVRIHRSFIVNVRFIKELNSHYNGDYTVVMKNDTSVKLSRNYREQLMRLIN